MTRIFLEPLNLGPGEAYYEVIASPTKQDKSPHEYVSIEEYQEATEKLIDALRDANLLIKYFTVFDSEFSKSGADNWVKKYKDLF